VPGEQLVVLLDHVGTAGGAERYWRVVIPALREAGIAVRVLARTVDAGAAAAFDATQIGWAGDDGGSDARAAEQVREAIRAAGGATVVTASVFDSAVLDAVRDEAARWIVRVHDHRAFCPNGDRVFPQFAAICTQAMGAACIGHTIVHGCMHGPRLASLDRLTRRLAVRDRFARADLVLVSSDYMRASAVANHIDPRRVAITAPPLTDTAYARHERPRPERDTVLFSGRLTPQKGLQSLLRALARIDAARRPHLIVAGTGRDEEPARALAARLGVSVEWRGWLRTLALREAIDAATIVAVPSLEPEPFGLVGIEAQARGRPAVAYDVGGITDWLGDAGYAVARGDEQALADAIVALLAPATWDDRSRAARRSSERFRLQPHLDALLAILDGANATAVTAAAATTPAARATRIPRSQERPSRRVAGRRSSGS
jgi:glycosyltransferase involved in cell wall biosynthesis